MIVLELIASIRAEPRQAEALLRAFVEGHGFPIVENNTATFFYWDAEPTKAVNLRHWVFGLESEQPFERILGTDAFYLSIDLPHSARVEYKLELVRGGKRRWLRDPLNPRRAYDPFGSNSVCPMPGYITPSWVEPEATCRRGAVESFALLSEVYDQEREITIYLPNEYKAHKRYPLLICHDGSDYRRFASMIDVLDNLIHRREVRPLVVVFTDGQERNEEYGADPRQADFLVQELLPGVRERYGVTRERSQTGCMGASFGAVSSLYAATRHPEAFGKLLLQSGSFVYTDIGHHGRSAVFDPVVAFVNEFRQDPGSIDARVFLSCGTFESLIQFNRALVPRMRDAGLTVRLRESQDGHNWIAWRDRLRDGLSWLYPGHLWMWYD